MSVSGWSQVACLALGVAWLRAQSIPVPNGSFEEPSTAFVDLRIDPWQRTEKPIWFDEGGGFLWGQLVGTFANTGPGKPDHIANLDGKQAAWLFAVSGAGVWQELGPEGSPNPIRYEPGKLYQLSVDVLGNGGGMMSGVPLEFGLCFLQADGTRSWLARRAIPSSPALFPVRTQMTTFRVTTPVVTAGDPWAGRPVAVMAVCTVSREQEGGYWDIDNFRVMTASAPAVTLESGAEGLSLSWGTSRGWRYRAWRSGDLRAWSPLPGVVEGTGEAARVSIAGEGDGHAFYRVEVASGE